MKTCLVVDDSATVRKVVRRIIEALGFQVVEAEDGVAALTAYDARVPDLIMLDWNMPRMDGLSFLHAIRDRREPEKPVVIFCTTMNGLGHINDAITAGADEYIMKPFDEEIVRGKLEQVGLI